jgi:hypothetical protein
MHVYISVLGMVDTDKKKKRKHYTAYIGMRDYIKIL